MKKEAMILKENKYIGGLGAKQEKGKMLYYNLSKILRNKNFSLSDIPCDGSSPK